MKNLFYCGIKVILRSLSNDQATMASTVTSSQLLLGSETLRCLHECFELQKSCLVFHMVIRIYSNSRITSVSASESFISDSPLPPPSPSYSNQHLLLYTTQFHMRHTFRHRQLQILGLVQLNIFQWLSNMIPAPEVLTSPGNLLKMQILRPNSQNY